LEVDKSIQLEEAVPTGRDFVPIVEVFDHRAFDFAPTVGYLAYRDDFDLESLEIIHP